MRMMKRAPPKKYFIRRSKFNGEYWGVARKYGDLRDYKVSDKNKIDVIRFTGFKFLTGNR